MAAAIKPSLKALELFAMIRAKLEENNGHPVMVKNPLVIELIDAGFLVETAPRDNWTAGGIAQMMAVVNLPEGVK